MGAGFIIVNARSSASRTEVRDLCIALAVVVGLLGVAASSTTAESRRSAEKGAPSPSAEETALGPKLPSDPQTLAPQPKRPGVQQTLGLRSKQSG